MRKHAVVVQPECAETCRGTSVPQPVNIPLRQGWCTATARRSRPECSHTATTSPPRQLVRPPRARMSSASLRVLPRHVPGHGRPGADAERGRFDRLPDVHVGVAGDEHVLVVQFLDDARFLAARDQDGRPEPLAGGSARCRTRRPAADSRRRRRGVRRRRPRRAGRGPTRVPPGSRRECLRPRSAAAARCALAGPRRGPTRTPSSAVRPVSPWAVRA